MINFREELQKFKPVLEIDDIEDSIHSDELQDLLDILNHISSSKIDAEGTCVSGNSKE